MRCTAPGPARNPSPTTACSPASSRKTESVSSSSTTGAGTRTAANKSEAINEGFKDKCDSIDKPISALLTDLEQRGMLEDTLVVWGGEFGRTPMQENRGGGSGNAFVGRDHNPNAFTIWMAGAGVKPGISYGETDEMGYHVASDPVPLRDFHATLLHLFGFDHKRLSFPFQGLDQKLTGVKSAKVVKGILS